MAETTAPPARGKDSTTAEDDGDGDSMGWIVAAVVVALLLCLATVVAVLARRRGKSGESGASRTPALNMTSYNNPVYDTSDDGGRAVSIVRRDRGSVTVAQNTSGRAASIYVVPFEDGSVGVVQEAVGNALYGTRLDRMAQSNPAYQAVDELAGVKGTALVNGEPGYSGYGTTFTPDEPGYSGYGATFTPDEPGYSGYGGAFDTDPDMYAGYADLAVGGLVKKDAKTKAKAAVVVSADTSDLGNTVSEVTYDELPEAQPQGGMPPRKTTTGTTHHTTPLRCPTLSAPPASFVVCTCRPAVRAEGTHVRGAKQNRNDCPS